MSNLSHLMSVQTFDKWSPTKLHTVPPLEKEKCNWLYKLLLLLIQKFGDLLMLPILPRRIVKPVKCEHKHTHTHTALMLGRNWAQTLLLFFKAEEEHQRNVSMIRLPKILLHMHICFATQCRKNLSRAHTLVHCFKNIVNVIIVIINSHLFGSVVA